MEQGYNAVDNMDCNGADYYSYDAEGRVCAVQTYPTGGPAAYGYIYDADGNRVAKGTITPSPNPLTTPLSCDPATNGFTMTGNNTGTYVLGPGGQELTQLRGSGAWQRTNVFGAGKQLATYDSMGLHFQIEDALGTRRMQTNADGQPETDIQSLPYGDALVTANDQYAPATADDAIPLHFTGKERDSESGNDYFGARYYASTMARFLSPDPKTYSAQRMLDPQQWNMYSYVSNNPLIAFDPDGKELKLIIVNSSKYSDTAMRQVGNEIAGSLTRAGVLNVSVEVSHSPFWSKVRSIFSGHVHSIEYGPDGGSVKVKEQGGKDAAGVTVTNEGFTPGHSYSGVDTNDTGANGEVMANYGKHEVGHDAGNPDVAPTASNSSDPMVSPTDGKGNKEYTPTEAEKLRLTYNRKDEKEKQTSQ